MTVSVLIGIIFLLAGMFVLSPSLSSAMRMRAQIGRYPLVKVIIGFISLIILISVSLQDYWYEELWRVVVLVAFVFALLQLISTLFTMKIWDGITDFVRKYPFIIFIIMVVLGLLLIVRSYIGPVAAVEECKSNQDIGVICSVKNPEDLAVTPDNNFLIVSEFGGIEPLEEMTPGKLSL